MFINLLWLFTCGFALGYVDLKQPNYTLNFDSNADTHSLKNSNQSIEREQCITSKNCDCSDVCVSIDDLLAGPANGTCLGTKLPYILTAQTPITGQISSPKLVEELESWAALKAIPHCWTKLQTFLCAVYVPECRDKGTVVRPAREMCEAVRKSCPLLVEGHLLDPPPRFLDCSQYTSDCTRRNKLNFRWFKVKGRCRPPLVNTIKKRTWFKGIDGCGFECRTPHFSPSEYTTARVFIGVLAVGTFLVNVAVLVTVALAWPMWREYPRVVLVYMHACLLIGCLGWLVQFLPGLHTDIVCRRDGTLRISEPQVSSGETVTCVLVFAIVYFTVLAATVWSAVFAHALYMRLRALESLIQDGGHDDASPETNQMLDSTVNPLLTNFQGDKSRPRRSAKIRNRSMTSLSRDQESHGKRLMSACRQGRAGLGGSSNNRLASVHLLSWAIPFVLTIGCLTTGEIDANPVSGICFVGHVHPPARIGLVIIPLLVCFVVKAVFMGKACVYLRNLRKHLLSSERKEDEEVARDFKQSFYWFVVLLLLLGSLLLFSCGVHLYIYVNEGQWKQSLRKKVLCELRDSIVPDTLPSSICALESKPRLGIVLLHCSAFFIYNLIYTSAVLADRCARPAWIALCTKLRQRFGHFGAGRPVEGEDGERKMVPPPAVHQLIYMRAMVGSWWDPGIFPPPAPRKKGTSDDEDDDARVELNDDELERLAASSRDGGHTGSVESSLGLGCSAGGSEVAGSTRSLAVTMATKDAQSVRGQKKPRSHLYRQSQSRSRQDLSGAASFTGDRSGSLRSIVQRSHSFGASTAPSSAGSTAGGRGAQDRIKRRRTSFRTEDLRRRCPRRTPSSTGDSRQHGGSWTSLKSAQSYNSYRLAGACQASWRTRLLLLDVWRWASAVAPYVTQGYAPFHYPYWLPPGMAPPPPATNVTTATNTDQSKLGEGAISVQEGNTSDQCGVNSPSMKTKILNEKLRADVYEKVNTPSQVPSACGHDSDDFDSEDEVISLLDGDTGATEVDRAASVHSSGSDAFCSSDEVVSDTVSLVAGEWGQEDEEECRVVDFRST